MAPNGLDSIVCGLQHRHSPSKRGRGKFYHLSWLSAAARAKLAGELFKHAEVCARVGLHPQIAVNLSSAPTPHEDGWWVIDDWGGRETLADRLALGPWPKEDVPRLLDEIAAGLAALHAAGVVFRELAPTRILIAERDGRAVLTNFELARLLDGVPSGQRDWPEDPFRAPEIDGAKASVQSDLYSLGQVALAAIAGLLPPEDQIPVVLGMSGMTKKLQRMLVDCLEPLPSWRPPDVETLAPHLAAWRKGRSA